MGISRKCKYRATLHYLCGSHNGEISQWNFKNNIICNKVGIKNKRRIEYESNQFIQNKIGKNKIDNKIDNCNSKNYIAAIRRDYILYADGTNIEF